MVIEIITCGYLIQAETTIHYHMCLLFPKCPSKSREHPRVICDSIYLSRLSWIKHDDYMLLKFLFS